MKSMMDPRNAKNATEPLKVTARYIVGSLLSMVIKKRLRTTANAAHARMRYQFRHESPSITRTNTYSTSAKT